MFNNSKYKISHNFKPIQSNSDISKAPFPLLVHIMIILSTSIVIIFIFCTIITHPESLYTESVTIFSDRQIILYEVDDILKQEYEQNIDYEKALKLLKIVINKDPNACDIDHFYTEASFCLANLGRFEECLKYYEITHTFHRRQQNDFEFCGSYKNWEELMNKIKALALLDPKGRTFFNKMLIVDKTEPKDTIVPHSQANEKHKGLFHFPFF